ncbi:hypothetical protein D3C73_388100 [compost metagenome]
MGYETKFKGKFKQNLFSSSLEKVAPGVTFSTDYMSEEEIAALSGPVHEYTIKTLKGA